MKKILTFEKIFSIKFVRLFNFLRFFPFIFFQQSVNNSNLYKNNLKK